MPRREVRPVVWTALLILGLLSAGGAVYVALRVYPWLRGPDESGEAIERRWVKVERFAEVPLAHKDLEPNELAAFASPFRGWEAPRGQGDVPLVDEESLTPARRAALERLEEWERSGAPLPDRSCPADVPPGGQTLDLLRAARAATFTARGADQAGRIRAVLTLAQRLRQRGTLVDLAVGAELAAGAAEWTRVRGVALPEELDRHRPHAREIHATLAREAVCIIDRLEGGAGFELHGSPGNGPPFGIVRLERERRVYKDFHGRLLERLEPSRDDWRAMKRIHEEAHAAKPKSLLLDVAAIHAGVIESVGEKLDRFDAIAGPPPKASP